MYYHTYQFFSSFFRAYQSNPKSVKLLCNIANVKVHWKVLSHQIKSTKSRAVLYWRHFIHHKLKKEKKNAKYAVNETRGLIW